MYPPETPTLEPYAMLLMEGGHKTTLAGISVGEAEQIVRDGRADEVEGETERMVYFQPDNRPANSVCVRPSAVVAIVARMP